MISILTAYTKTNRVIGNNGKIPWNLPSERDRFKAICKNKAVIMGRKTFEEIGKALSYCTIVIISKTLKKVPEGCLLATTLTEGINIAKNFKTTNNEILIAGGGQIYKQALKLKETNKIYATEIEKEYKGNVYFPVLNDKWIKTEEENKIELGVNYKYITYEKRF